MCFVVAPPPEATATDLRPPTGVNCDGWQRAFPHCSSEEEEEEEQDSDPKECLPCSSCLALLLVFLVL